MADRDECFVAAEDGTRPTGVNVLWPQNHFQVQPVLGSWAAREHGRALHFGGVEGGGERGRGREREREREGEREIEGVFGSDQA